MKLLPIAGALFCLVALGGASCGEQRDGVVVLPPEKPRLDPPDSESMSDCLWPIRVEVVGMNQEQVEALLGGNADRHIACIYKHRALVKFIRTRDGGLTGRAAK